MKRESARSGASEVLAFLNYAWFNDPELVLEEKYLLS